MKNVIRPAATILLAAAMLAGVAGGCRRQAAPPAPPPAVQDSLPPFDKVWTAEEIAKDPALYMRWAEKRIGGQIADRQERLKLLSARLSDVKLHQRNFQDKMRDVENIHSRMTTAVQRAEDEDRWPAVVGGQSFDQAKAKAIIDHTDKWLQQRRPLSAAYDQAVARLSQGQQDLQKDIEELGNLKDKVALDLERVRLTQGMEELAQLRQREQEIAGFAQALTHMADESAAISSLPPEDKEPAKVDIESFLK